MSNYLMLTASALFLIAFVMYNKGMLAGKNNPAIVAWALFSFITLVSGFTYLKMSGSWVLTVVVFTDCVVCVMTTLVALFRRNRNLTIDPVDRWAFGIGLAAILVWQLSSATYANWTVQIAYSVAFVPNYRNVWGNPRNEPTVPWVIWTVAFVLNIVVIAADPAATSAQLVTPVVCLGHHGAMSLLTLRKLQPAAAKA